MQLFYYLHRESIKNKTPNSCPWLHQILTDFQTFFTGGLGSKFATKTCLNIPPRLKCVATLPCQMWMSEKWHHSEICIVISDKSQCSIAKNSRNDEFLYYTFIIQSASERIFKIGEHLAKLQAKWWIVSCALFVLHFCPQTCWSRQISWITCVLQTETVTNRCYVNSQIKASLLSTYIKLL